MLISLIYFVDELKINTPVGVVFLEYCFCESLFEQNHSIRRHFGMDQYRSQKFRGQNFGLSEDLKNERGIQPLRNQ